MKSWRGCGVVGLWVFATMFDRKLSAAGCTVTLSWCVCVCVCVCVCTSNQVCQRVVIERAFKMVGVKGRARSQIPSHDTNSGSEEHRY